MNKIDAQENFISYEKLSNWSYGVTLTVIGAAIFLVRLVLSLDNDKTNLQLKHLEVIIDTKINHIDKEIEKMNAKINTITKEVEDIFRHTKKNDNAISVNEKYTGSDLS